MEEIETYYVIDGDDATKVCWYPFKKAYSRRQMNAEEERRGALVRIRSVPLELNPLEHSESNVDNSTGDLTIRLNQRRSYESMGDSYSNSIISEGGQLTFNPQSDTRDLAKINTNPLSKELWADEICNRRSSRLRRASKVGGPDRDSVGRNSSSLDQRLGGGKPLQEILLEREKGSVISRVGQEVDFSNERNYSSSSYKNGRSTKSSGRSVKARELMSDGCCAMKTSWPNRGGSLAASTDVSSVDSETDATSIADSMSGKMRSVESKDVSKESHVIEDNRVARHASVAYKEAKTPRTEVPQNGLLCGTLQCGKMTPGHLPGPIPLVQKVPSRIHVSPESRLTDASSRASMESRHAQSKKTTSENDLPLADVHAISLQSMSPDLAEGELNRNPEGEIAQAGCLSSATLGALLMAQAASGLVPQSWRTSATNVPDRSDPNQPHFFVEVEATKKQLEEVKDLAHIKTVEDLRRPVEMSKMRSLVDEDSAFMDSQCIEVDSHLSPTRSSPGMTQSMPGRRQLRNSHVEVGTSARPTERPLMSANRIIGRSKVVPMTENRNIRSQREASTTNPSNPTMRKQRSENEPPPSKTRSLDPVHEDTIADRSGANRNYKSSSSPRKAIEKIATKSVVPASFPVPTPKEQEIMPHTVDPPNMTVIHLKSRRSVSTAKSSNESTQLTQDFDLARFPSLSSEDWNTKSFGTIIQNRKQDPSPPWWEGYYDENMAQSRPSTEWHTQEGPRVNMTVTTAGFTDRVASSSLVRDPVPALVSPTPTSRNFRPRMDAVVNDVDDDDDDSIFTGLIMDLSWRPRLRSGPPSCVETRKVETEIEFEEVTMADSDFDVGVKNEGFKEIFG